MSENTTLEKSDMNFTGGAGALYQGNDGNVMDQHNNLLIQENRNTESDQLNYEPQEQ